MIAAKILFWLSSATLAYHMVGYGIILYAINEVKKKRQAPPSIGTELMPRVIVLCAAYNEEKSIGEKIESFLGLDYPSDRISMIVVSDDSTDRTNEIVESYAGRNVRLIVQQPRKGKQSAHNLALPELDCDYVVSTDANSIFDPKAVRIMISMILSAPNIGMVTGELRLFRKSGKASGEGLYWKYEAFLKRMDSQFKSVICANGSLYLIRRELFTEVHPGTVDDFERTLQVMEKGLRVAYEPNAWVGEEETESANQEISRKVRIITREWQAMGRHLTLLNPFRHPKVSFLLWSHKLLRWPFFVFVLTIYITSGLLIFNPVYLTLFILQTLFYAWGVIGLIAQRSGWHPPLSGIASYVVAMVYSSAMAMYNLVMNRSTGMWKPIR